MQENLSRLTEDLGVFVAKMETNFANSLSETNASTALALNSSLQPTMQKLEAVMTNIQTQQEQSSMKFIEESMQAMKEAINIGTNDEMDKLKSTMEIISAKNSEMVETFTSSNGKYEDANITSRKLNKKYYNIYRKYECNY